MLGRLQPAEREEERAAAGHVGFTLGPLEGHGAQVRPEGINGVLTVVLVQEHEGDLRARAGGGQVPGSAPRGSELVCACHLCSPSDPELRWVRSQRSNVRTTPGAERAPGMEAPSILSRLGGCPILRALTVYPMGKGNSDVIVNFGWLLGATGGTEL